MKLTALLKEVQEEQKHEFEFETDAHGNLEVWSADHEDLLAIVDKQSGNIDYRPALADVRISQRAAIEAAAERFLDDEESN